MRKFVFMFVLPVVFCVATFGQTAGDFKTEIVTSGTFSTITIIGYTGSSRNVVIPAQIDGKRVTIIGDGAFRNSNVDQVVIPDGVIAIGEEAFQSSKIQSITIPDSVVTIGEMAFQESNLSTVRLPQGLTEISMGLFGECQNLTEVIIPSSVTAIWGFAFFDTPNLKKITIPPSVTICEISSFAFNGRANEDKTFSDEIIRRFGTNPLKFQ